jgi:hypothetical protein
MTWYIGIDPGKTGAICALNPELSNPIEFVDINTQGDVLYNILMNSTPVRIMVEKVTVVQTAGRTSCFNFGANVGRIRGILEATGLGYDDVAPKEWQKGCGIVMPKKATQAAKKKTIAERVKQVYPQADIYGPKGGLIDGRADALMIAHYCMLKYILQK